RRLADAARRSVAAHRLRPRDSGESGSHGAPRSARSGVFGNRRRARAGGRTGGTHLQSRPRDPADDAPRARPGARAICSSADADVNEYTVLPQSTQSTRRILGPFFSAISALSAVNGFFAASKN